MEIWNGSAWSFGGYLNDCGFSHSGHGTVNAAMISGGSRGSPYKFSETYDGTTWSNEVPLLIVRSVHGSVGSQQAGVVFGGTPATLDSTSEFNKAHRGASYLLTKKIKAQE